MISDWKKEIAVAWYVQTETAKVDTNKLWTYYLPCVAATGQELAQTETMLGHALDPRYRKFLSFANGWRCFYQRVDLFGTAELQGGPAMHMARAALENVDVGSLAKSKIMKSDLIPVGFSSEQSDLFVLLKPDSANPGTIVWLAGYEIDRFSSFDDFFLAMVDYNRLRLDRLRSDHAGCERK